MLVPAGEKASSLKKQKAHKRPQRPYLQNNSNKHPFFPVRILPTTAAQRKQSWGSCQNATGACASSAPAPTSAAAREPCVAPQSCQSKGRAVCRTQAASFCCQPPGSVCDAPGAPRLPPRPGMRARARPGRFPFRASVRAPHAQSAPAVSVCLNRKADILVPHGPPRPTPSGIRRRHLPFPQPGPQRLPEDPSSAAAGTRLPSSSPSALQPFQVSIGHRPRPAPPDTAADAPAATGQNGKVRLSREDQLSANTDRCIGSGQVEPGMRG